MAETGLFSTDLISPTVAASLPDGYKVRALRPYDYDSGFLACLKVLTKVGDITKEAFEERYNWMATHKGTYYILVIEDTTVEKPIVVGTGALLVEKKLYVPVN